MEAISGATNIFLSGGLVTNKYLTLKFISRPSRRELTICQIVHGDIHPGNVVLPPPLDSDIERLLEQEPLEHRICRKDGAPTSRLLPERVTEPVDIGYGVGQVQIIDLGTVLPFLVDSWQLGLTLYFILTDG
ncbi:hypothetical protein VDGE_30482 [Verticillium dahliae]|uniref:Protein kinase domain-containing protein n=1 Tax=Verticillium dahliae TaxID=27337 RepID=A0A444RSG3_VERDA|nr:hypothetical protein VDGE_30482 [Verticillium dahliae]